MTDLAEPTKQLYWFSTEPGDPDHMDHYYFDRGVVEADPAEIAALLEAVGENHGDVLFVRPLAEKIRSIASLRQAAFDAIETYHTEVDGTELCEADEELRPEGES